MKFDLILTGTILALAATAAAAPAPSNDAGLEARKVRVGSWTVGGPAPDENPEGELEERRVRVGSWVVGGPAAEEVVGEDGEDGGEEADAEKRGIRKQKDRWALGSFGGEGL